MIYIYIYTLYDIYIYIYSYMRLYIYIYSREDLPLNGSYIIKANQTCKTKEL